jgi:hypothetical protein
LIASIIAHELSHSIDPCRIQYGPEDAGFKYSRGDKNKGDVKKAEKEYPVPNVISCLRDDKSVGAINMADFHANGDCPDKEDFPQDGASLNGAPPKNICTDQLTESFPDWMAAEVLPKYIESNFKLTAEQYRAGYANVHRLGCQNTPYQLSSSCRFDPHPTTEDRVDSILLVNPDVRRQMGCPVEFEDHLYCSPDKPYQPTDKDSSAPTKKEGFQ